MNEPVHSFAVLAYGRPPYLEECLRSLEQQTCRSTIYIATSTPSPFLEEAARRHHLQLLVNPERRGIAADWTFAYSHCTTRFLTLAHQDDRYLPAYARECIATAKRHAGSLIVFTDYIEQTARGLAAVSFNLLVKRMIIATAFGWGTTIAATIQKRGLLSLGCPIPCPSVMYDTKTIGTFSFAPEFNVNLDWEAWSRLAVSPGRFSYVPRKLMVHRLHDGAETSRNIADGRRQREDLMMFERFWPQPIARAIAYLYALSLVTRRCPPAPRSC